MNDCRLLSIENTPYVKREKSASRNSVFIYKAV